MSRFLRVCAFLFVSLLSTNLFAAGYTCNTQAYISCAAGYYMVGASESISCLLSGTTCTWNGTPEAGNTCQACPADAAFCPGGTDAPVYQINGKNGTVSSILGYYSASAGFCTDAENCKTGGSSVVTSFTSLPTKGGHIFAGYYSAATSDTQHVTPNGVIVTNASSLSGPQTWHAQWNICPAGSYCDGSTPTAEVSCPSGWQSDAGTISKNNCYKTFVLDTNGATFATNAWSGPTLNVPNHPLFAQVAYNTTTSKFQVRVSFMPTGVQFVIPDSRTEPTDYTLSGGLGTASTCTTGPTETNYMAGGSWMYNIFPLIQNQTHGSTIYLCRVPNGITFTYNGNNNTGGSVPATQTCVYGNGYDDCIANALRPNLPSIPTYPGEEFTGFTATDANNNEIPTDDLSSAIAAIKELAESGSTIITMTATKISCLAGYYCPANAPRTACPTGWTSDTGSDDINDCYFLINLGIPGILYDENNDTTILPENQAKNSQGHACELETYHSLHVYRDAECTLPTVTSGDTFLDTSFTATNRWNLTPKDADGEPAYAQAVPDTNAFTRIKLTSTDDDKTTLTAGNRTFVDIMNNDSVAISTYFDPITILFLSNVTKITCDPGYYLPAGSSRCESCTSTVVQSDALYCAGGEPLYFNANDDQGTAPCADLSGIPNTIDGNYSVDFGSFSTSTAIASDCRFTPNDKTIDPSCTFTGNTVAYDGENWGTNYYTGSSSNDGYTAVVNGTSLTCPANTYTASYSCGSGTGNPPSNAPATYNSNFTLDDNTCSRTGYTFNGWSDGTTTREDGETFTWTYTTNKTFTAQWKPNTYTVAYNANGGTGTTANSSHTYNLSKALTANGFTNGTKKFLGWSTSSTAATATYTNKQNVYNLTATNGATVTLYAVWEDCTPCANNASVDCTLTAPLGVCTWTTTCKQGYNTITNNGAYNATCTANTINLTWANGGRGTAPTTPASCTYGGTFTMPSAMTATGYTFNKWSVHGNTFAAGATNVACTYANLGVYSDTATITGTWNANNYTITLNKNNTGANDTATGSTTLYTKYNTNVYNDSNRTKAMTTSTNGFTAPKREFTVTFNANGGSVSPTSATATSTFKGYYSAATGGTQYTSAGTGTQYILANGLTAGKGYTSNATWHAQWTPNPITLPTPTRTGYTFVGWATDDDATSGVTGSYTPTASVTLYAIWTPKQFTITLDKNNTGANDTATGSTTLYTKYDSGAYIDISRSKLMSASANPLTIPKRAFTVSFSATGATVASRTATSTFNGYYGAAATRVVSASGYITTDGTNAAKGYTANQTWTAGWTNGTITLPSATKTGYTVTEWYTNSALTASAGKPGATYTPSASVTLYGKWTANVTGAITLDSKYYATSSTTTGTAVTTNAAPTPVYIKYNTGWYSNSAATTSITKLSTNPAYTGYDFGGFYTGKAGTGTQMVDASGNFTATSKTQYTTAGATATWYAHWIPDGETPFVVNHYTKNLGASTYTLHSTEDKTGTTGASITLASYKKTITGFTYVEGFAGTAATGTTKPTSGAVTSTTILASGTRVINLYYNRVITTITVSKNNGSGSLTVNGTTATGTTNVSFTCEYGATFTLPAWNGSANALALTKKVFTGWDKTGTITCGTADQTITAQWATPTCTAGTGVNTTSLKEVTNNAPVCNRSSKCGYYCSATQTGNAGATSLNTTCTKTSAGYYAAAGATTQTKTDAGYYAAAGACTQTKIDPGCFGGAGSSTACPKSCDSLGGGLYKNSNAGAKSENECYITTTGGYYVADADDTTQTKCPIKQYCATETLHWPDASVLNSKAENIGWHDCPATTNRTMTTIPDVYRPYAADGTVLTGTAASVSSATIQGYTNGLKSIAECRAIYSIQNIAGYLTDESVLYNTTTGKYDKPSGSAYYTSVNAGYWLNTRYGDAYCDNRKETDYQKTLYKRAIVCPAGSYCPGMSSMPRCYGNPYPAEGIGKNSCEDDTIHYTLSAEKSEDIDACYLITEPTKYVATAGAGQVTCACGGYCLGNTKVYYNTTGGRDTCDAGTYNAATGASAESSCKAADAGYYVQNAGMCNQTVCSGATYSTTTGQAICKTCPTATNNASKATTYSYWNTGKTGDHTTVTGCYVYYENEDLDDGSMSLYYCYADTDAATTGEYGVDGTSKGCWVYWERLKCDGGYYNKNYSTSSNYDFTNKTIANLKNNACIAVESDYWSANDALTRTACDPGLVTCGSGKCANEAEDCGRKLHAGDNVIYLRSAVRTTPSLRVKVGETTFYGALSTSLINSLKVKKDGTEYSVVNDYQ